MCEIAPFICNLSVSTKAPAWGCISGVGCPSCAVVVKATGLSSAGSLVIG